MLIQCTCTVYMMLHELLSFTWFVETRCLPRTGGVGNYSALWDNTLPFQKCSSTSSSSYWGSLLLQQLQQRSSSSSSTAARLFRPVHHRPAMEAIGDEFDVLEASGGKIKATN